MRVSCIMVGSPGPAKPPEAEAAIWKSAAAKAPFPGAGHIAQIGYKPENRNFTLPTDPESQLPADIQACQLA
jgi:hypothetical protein